MTQIKYIFFPLLVFSVCPAFAVLSSDSFKDIEISVGAGPSWVNANDGTVQSGSDEIDKLAVNSHTPTSVLETMGVGYHLFSDVLSQRKYFNDLLVELNVYHVNASINGQVWQYGDNTQLNNYTFKAPLSSTSLMFDVKPSLFTIDYVSPYPIVGVGFGWNKLSYNEALVGNTASSDNARDLATSINRKIAYDAGAGLRYRVNQHVNASLEYLYHYMGDLSSSSTVTSGSGANFGGATFLTHSQNLVLNIGWQF